MLAYFGNFCTGLMSKLSSVNLPLCSRAIFSRKRAKAGLWLQVVRIADFARLTLLTNSVSIFLQQVQHKVYINKENI